MSRVIVAGAAVALFGGAVLGCSSVEWEPAKIPPETMITPPVPGEEKKSELDAAFDDMDDETPTPTAPEPPADPPAPDPAASAPTPDPPAAPAAPAAPKKKK
jgi:hypothetical protein